MIKDWCDEKGYYHTTKPCAVCGAKGENGIEPRFSYVVCEEHSKLSPIEISKIIGEKHDQTCLPHSP